MKSFSELPLTPPILKSLERMSYAVPTDVQARTIPLVLEGRDVLVTAQTGTGKTAAFGVPVLQRMIAALDAGEPVKRALILAPTRELAEQILTVIRELTFFYRRIRSCVVIGGAPYGKQFRELGQNPAFVVGTPGRLIDHIETKTLNLADFDVLILDEADRMLDMGFAPQIEMIVKTFPAARQTMMFSATLPNEVKSLVAKYLRTPARVAIGEENRPVAAIQQDVVEVKEGDKSPRLMHEIDGMAGSIIVFTKTKLKADVVASLLSDAGHKAEALHGDLTQGARRRVTSKFRDGEIRILVATDIAARGLDIDHIRHVVNFDLPMVPEDYIHRIGRTGRAGKEGHSVAFVTPQERGRWNQILRLMGLPSQGNGRGGKTGYKGAATRSAFSGGAPSRGNERAKPFAKPYEGMKGPAKFQKPERAERAGARPKHGRPPGFASPEAQAVRDEFQSRAEYAEQKRAEKFGRAPRFAKSGAAGGRAAAARPASEGRSSDSRPRPGGPKFGAPKPGGPKPHKGKADTRQRKSNARNPAKAAAPGRPTGGRPGAAGGNRPPKRRR